MSESDKSPEQQPQFPTTIGDDYDLWKKYREIHGHEAYKYRRSSEELARQLFNLYIYAEEHNIDLPGPHQGMELT